MNRVTQLDTEQLLLYDFDAVLHKKHTRKSYTEKNATAKNETQKNDKTISLEYIVLWQILEKSHIKQAQQNMQKKGGE